MLGTTLSVSANTYTKANAPAYFQNEAMVKHSFNNDSKILSLNSNVRLTEVVIYNIIGQQTFKKQLNGLQTRIQLSDLKKGVYIAKLKGSNFTKTIRLVIK
jgi:hypothetical protein